LYHKPDDSPKVGQIRYKVFSRVGTAGPGKRDGASLFVGEPRVGIAAAKQGRGGGDFVPALWITQLELMVTLITKSNMKFASCSLPVLLLDRA
jgi:hypothetical protein